ncbi:MAG: hypothetical protein GXP30_13215 [Verrucomicrobia bacterium]|nr:hypothetical protein [Verrucomicrobiota bacterium]
MNLTHQQSSNKAPRVIYIAVLLLVTIFYRLFASQTAVADWLGNTSPLMAIAFGGGMLLGKRFWWTPALLLIVSDLFLALYNGWGLGSHLLYTLPFYVIVSLAGAGLARRQNWGVMLVGTLAASFLFYLIANTFAWATSPLYTHNFVGWWQSQSSGLPGYPPSWIFLRNSLVGDTIWCLIAAPLFFSKTFALPSRGALSDNCETVLFS